jgi:hypothetical protein
MSTLRLTWNPSPSFNMVYAKALGYIFEVHSSPVPLYGAPSTYVVTCRHVDVMGGVQRTRVGEFAEEHDGKLAAEAWFIEKLAALGFAPVSSAPVSYAGSSRLKGDMSRPQ